MGYKVYGNKLEDRQRSVEKILEDVDQRLKRQPITKVQRNPLIIPFYVDSPEGAIVRFASPVDGILESATFYLATEPANFFGASLLLSHVNQEAETNTKHSTYCNTVRELKLNRPIKKKDLITISLQGIQVPADQKDLQVTVLSAWTSLLILPETGHKMEIVTEGDANA